MDLKTLRYTPTHEWVQLEGDVARIGITRFRGRSAHRLDHDRASCGGNQELSAGKAFGEIESVKAVSDLYAPLSGTVTAVNAAVAANVQLLAEDPYDAGWLIKVKVDQPALRPADLLDLDAYEKKVAEDAH